MINTKDSIANITTFMGTGAGFFNINGYLTLGLITTGIVLNIYRIYEIRRKSKDSEE
jgi:hypothetical protein